MTNIAMGHNPATVEVYRRKREDLQQLMEGLNSKHLL
jgi:hypothetical protein